MKSNPINILIINCYSWFNKGDAAIVIGMVKSIRNFFPNSHITALTYTPEIDDQNYRKHSLSISGDLYVEILRKNEPYFIKFIRISYRVLKDYLNLKIRPHAIRDPVLRKYIESDIIISVGGGYLGGNSYGALLKIFRIHFGNILHKKVVLWAQSVEPTHKRIIRFFLRYVLTRTTLVITRNWDTYNYLKSIGIRKNIEVAGDAAFLVDATTSDHAKNLLMGEGITEPNRMLVGITVMSWVHYLKRDSDENFTNYVNVISQIVEDIITRHNASVIFFPHVTVEPYDDDRIVADMIIEKIPENVRKSVYNIKSDYGVEEIKGMIGQMNFFIGTRMHSCIFALSMNVPTICLSYQFKSKSLMDSFGMSEYLVDVISINNEIVGKIFEDISSKNQLIQEQLKIKNEEMKALSMHSGELLLTIFN